MTSNRHPKQAHKGQPSTRSRTTRSSKATLCDPVRNTQLLTEQLRSLGLYAAHTVGDGNCLFRALSDQLFGTQNQHLRLREDVCDWIASRRDRYAPFVEDERGLDVHLRCMRTPGTYGGHLELSAFAHLRRRNVKVIQPGLVYVLEWSTGVDDDASPEDDADDRERRRMRRTKQKSDRSAQDPEEETSRDTIYVAYHDWEHFSSVRNLGGPHNGIPNVIESVPPEAPPEPSVPSKHKIKTAIKSQKRSARSASTKAAAAPPAPSPCRIPLPLSPESISRPLSPATQVSSSSAASLSTSVQSTGFPKSSTQPEAVLNREGRSPKRSFEEAEQDNALVSASDRKRQRQVGQESTDGSDMDWATAPPIRALSESSLSSLSDPDDEYTESSGSYPPSPPSPPPPPPPSAAKPLTRRQRKALGLPKPRPAPVAATAGSNKIKIPGGRFRGKEHTPQEVPSQAQPSQVGGTSGDWQSNGTGRVDVRGFRELRI